MFVLVAVVGLRRILRPRFWDNKLHGIANQNELRARCALIIPGLGAQAALHHVGLTLQKRPDWFIISCVPAAGSVDANQVCSGGFLSGAEGVRILLVKPDQGGNK